MKYLLFVLLLVTVLITAGCTSENKNVVVTPPQIVKVTVESPVTSTPILTATPSLVTNNTPSPSVVSTIATSVPQPIRTINLHDALVFENIVYKKSSYGISDCVMKLQFPEIANDPDYGIMDSEGKIRSNNTKLVGISNEKWNSFYQDVVTGKKEGQSQSVSVYRCQNIPYSEDSTWDMFEISVRVVPRNTKPSDFMILFTLIADNGRQLGQIAINETLTMDRPIILQTNIPIKRTEINRLGTPKISFNRLTNEKNA